jgi:cell fate regulator YaaT (PSP1 superfamily)
MSEIYPLVVGIRFSRVNKIYHFDARNYKDIGLNDFVIVETSKGKQIGEVVLIKHDFEVEGEPLKPIESIATPRELVARETWNLKKEEIIQYCRQRVSELNLKDIRILDAEFSYDGSRITIVFSSSIEEKVDLKTLKFDVQKAFSVPNVEIRQVGPRDVAKIFGGMGACGMACRCCSRYLTEFNSISIKMAKEQSISLTPTEITGMCGRLRCCLVYENEYYVECRKRLPKKNKRVGTPQGEGKVLEVFPLRDSVLVDIPEVGRREFKRDQITFEENKVNKDDESEGS